MTAMKLSRAAADIPPMPLSDRAEGIPEALSIYINQLVYDMRRMGRDVITLSLGEAFFQIPLFDFAALDVEKCYHYSDSQGIPELRRKIADFYGKQYDAPVHMDEVLISAGSKVVIFLVMQSVLNAGEEILIHEPAWLSYQEQARLLGAEPRFIPYDAPIDTFANYITPKSRLLVINNPNNPSGRVYTKDELRSLYRQCRQAGVYVLVDEAYSDFLIGEGFTSMASVAPDKDGVIIVNSLSKNMGMSGWRVGYAISEPRIIKTLLKLNQHIVTCGPTILLHYMNHYFDEVISITLPQVREVVEKRKRVSDVVNSVGLGRLGGESTFYFFLSIGNFPGSSMDFAIHLLIEHGIAVVPGSAYGASTERFIRASIGTESEDRIAQALNVIRDLTLVENFDPAPDRKRLAEFGFPAFKPRVDRA